MRGQALTNARVLMYSHDSFGLGHLRRCRTIAHSLAAAHDDLSVLILSGSPIIGSFDFRSRVDFIRVPGVIKLKDGDYTTLSLQIAVDQTLSIRASIMEHTADILDPQAFIVDKEPLGLRGEALATLRLLKRRGARLILGLRDVMDDPAVLAQEWERKNVLPALIDLYDEIWVYGLPEVCRPLDGLDLPAAVTDKLVYTGYLRREPEASSRPPAPPRLAGAPYLLVTTGGGGDGEDLVDWVMSAYEHDPDLPLPALIVLGPFMAVERQAGFLARAQRLAKVEAIVFDAHVEALLKDAAGVVAMGGYNTFCEILSFDRPALIVPRRVPRLEQTIRARRAAELGLVTVLEDEDGQRDPAVMATALRALPGQRRPSAVAVPGLLDGLDSVNRLIAPWLSAPAPALAAIGGRG